jgi:hypothetical protein
MRRSRSRTAALGNKMPMKPEFLYERGRVDSPPQVVNLPHIRILAAVFATIALCAGAVYGDRLRPTKAMLTAFEKQFVGNVLAATKDSTVTFVDPPRAYYLDNFGIMMACEVSPVPGYGPTMFGPLNPEQIQLHHHKVEERLPILREQMKLALFDGATRFEALDDNDRLAVAVTVYHFAWENTTGIPSQIVIQGTRKALLEARAKTKEQGRDQAFQMKELY